MKELGSEFLREYAKSLEDERRLENVSAIRRCPALDQRMILSLNGSKPESSLPTVETVTKWLRERLISVSTKDEQTAILGLFYTKINCFANRPEVVAGIFPLYNKEIKYTIRPLEPIYTGWSVGWRKEGGIMLTQETVSENDPMLITNQEGFDFLCYKTSPFTSDNPYQTVLPDSRDQNASLSRPNEYELVLEENIIKRCLWHVSHKRKPPLFKQTGFAKFINSNCSDPRYIELHAAYTQSRIQTRSNG